MDGTITNDIRRSAFFVIIARDCGKQEQFSLCLCNVDGTQLGRDAAVLFPGSHATHLAYPATLPTQFEGSLIFLFFFLQDLVHYSALEPCKQ